MTHRKKLSALDQLEDSLDDSERFGPEEVYNVEKVEHKVQVSPGGKKYLDIGLGVKKNQKPATFGGGQKTNEDTNTADSSAEDDNTDFGDNNNTTAIEEAPSNGFSGDFKWDGFTETQAALDKNAGLLMEMDEKNKEIEQLGALLEALEPIPGLDPEKFLDIMQGTERVDKDIRDVKIVNLAKKSRNLNVALQKEKVKVVKLEEKVNVLQADLEAAQNKLQAGNQTQRSAAGAVSTQKHKQNAVTQESEESSGAKAKADAALTARVHDLRLQLDKANSDLKKTQRALQREIGEDASLEKALEEDSGWKGRAQQIVMLRSRIKQLEATVGDKGLKKDVDSRAQEDISSLTKARREEVEALAKQNESLKTEVEEVKGRYEKAKARVKVLEKESIRTKEYVRTLLGKAETDNQYVDALRAEVDFLKRQSRTTEEEQRSHLEKNRGRPSDPFEDNNRMSREEAQRLETLTRDQTRQITHQEEMMRQLRQEIKRLEEQVKQQQAELRNARESSHRRPTSSEIRSDAQGLLEQQTSAATSRMLEVENRRLSELSEMYKSRCSEAETKVEHSLRALQAAKQQLLEVERSRIPQADGSRNRSQGGELEALRSALDSQKAENSALRSSFQASVAGKEKELAITRQMLEEEKRVFGETVHRLQKQINGLSRSGQDDGKPQVDDEKLHEVLQDNEFLRRELDTVRARYDQLASRIKK